MVRIDSTLEAAAVCMDVPPHQGRLHYERWVKDEKPPACGCPPCTVVRDALKVQKERLERGTYRGAEGFWVVPDPEDKRPPETGDGARTAMSNWPGRPVE